MSYFCMNCAGTGSVLVHKDGEYCPCPDENDPDVVRIDCPCCEGSGNEPEPKCPFCGEPSPGLGHYETCGGSRA